MGMVPQTHLPHTTDSPSPTQGRLRPPDSVPGMQAALPCLLMAGDKGRSELTLRGGTDAAMAASVWYFQHVCLPLLRTWWGLEADVQVCRGLLRGRLASGRHCVRWMHWLRRSLPQSHCRLEAALGQPGQLWDKHDACSSPAMALCDLFQCVCRSQALPRLVPRAGVHLADFQRAHRAG